MSSISTGLWLRLCNWRSDPRIGPESVQDGGELESSEAGGRGAFSRGAEWRVQEELRSHVPSCSMVGRET